MEKQDTNVVADKEALDARSKENVLASPLLEKRASLYESYQKLQSDVLPVSETPAPDAEEKIQESESEKDSSVKESTSDSSSVKEDQELKVSDQEKENVKKALHEEREKRKEANRRLRELQNQYDSQIKALQSKVDQLVQTPPVADATAFTTDEQLKKEVLELRQEREREQQRKQQEEATRAQQSLQSSITKTTNELKADGFPGFNYALVKVDAAIAKRIEEGDLLPEDAKKPEVWKKVYMEDVYNDFISEFNAAKKVETVEQKVLAKQKAKLVGSPGSNPVKEEAAKEDDQSMETFNKKYFESRRANNPNKRKS